MKVNGTGLKKVIYQKKKITLMLAGPEVGDHFTLDLYNKVIPHRKF